MKIIGIGVDIISNNRIKKSINDKKFLDRIFSSNEIRASKTIKNKSFFLPKDLLLKKAL